MRLFIGSGTKIINLDMRVFIGLLILILIATACSISSSNTKGGDKLNHIDSVLQVSNSSQLGYGDTSRLILETKILYKKGAYSELLKVYDQLISIDSLNGSYHYHRGHCLIDLHRYDESIRSFNKSLRLNYRTCKSYASIAISLRYLHQLEKAVEFCKKGLKCDPDLPYGKVILDELNKELKSGSSLRPT